MDMLFDKLIKYTSKLVINNENYIKKLFDINNKKFDILKKNIYEQISGNKINKIYIKYLDHIEFLSSIINKCSSYEKDLEINKIFLDKTKYIIDNPPLKQLPSYTHSTSSPFVSQEIDHKKFYDDIINIYNVS